ncbi:hypothetical protein GQ53DRAFT_742291 [Thozetella sp. PMI_491]|nr:hypothetical protein GQ53DRAFT_742291 [Thozetella sp. PMI_491]
MVQVSATFRLPTWELDTTQPTVADETSARVLDVYKLPGFLSNFELSFANPLGSVPSDEDLAGPFPLVVHGRNGTPIPDLIGPENIDRLQDAVQTTYALIMAQLLNRGRMDFVGSSNETYEGTIIQRAEYRLKQSVISTRILEGLLTVIFIGVLVAFIRLRTKGVLPRPVFSIASGASLLAGSTLLRNLPEGTEQLSKKEIEEGGILRGMAFRLGWWEDEDESIVNRGNGEGVSTNETEGLRSRFGIDLDKDGDTE